MAEIVFHKHAALFISKNPQIFAFTFENINFHI